MLIQNFPAPLYRDPIYDGAADPVAVWCEKEKCYYMFYTQRRASSVQVDYSSIHGSDIGIAVSKDGMKWLYRGTVPGLAIEPGHNTFWAPEILFARGEYHMYVSYITGIPTDWDYPRRMLHYTSADLWNWSYKGEIPLSSDRVIDACVYEIKPGFWKMWYKDEDNHSYSYAAVSRDLYNWNVLGPEVTDCSHEGPNVFELGGKKWLIADFWNGLSVYSSEDFTHWTRQKENLLDAVELESSLLQREPGEMRDHSQQPAVKVPAHHADVFVENGRAVIFYFCHPFEKQRVDLASRTVILAGELEVREGKLQLKGMDKKE